MRGKKNEIGSPSVAVAVEKAPVARYGSRKAIRAAEDLLRTGVLPKGVANGNAAGRPPRGARTEDGAKTIPLFSLFASILAEVGKALTLSSLSELAAERIGKADPSYGRIPSRVAEFSRGTTNRAKGEKGGKPYPVRGRSGGIVFGPVGSSGEPTLRYDAKALTVLPLGSELAPVVETKPTKKEKATKS